MSCKQLVHKSGNGLGSQVCKCAWCSSLKQRKNARWGVVDSLPEDVRSQYIGHVCRGTGGPPVLLTRPDYTRGPTKAWRASDRITRLPTQRSSRTAANGSKTQDELIWK